MPGVSGGTVALVLGIYVDLIDNVRRAAGALGRLVRGDVRGAIDALRRVDWVFVIPLLVGIGAAVVALSGLIEDALHDHAEAMAGLFLGLVVGSIFVAWRLVRSPAPIHVVVALVVGAALFFALGFQSGPVTDPALPVFLGAGAIAICAMILPGISGSFLLLMMGMYAAVLGAVHDRELVQLGVFLLGAVIGLSLFSSLLSWLLDRYADLVLAALIGLMIGSLRVLWPWPNGSGSSATSTTRSSTAPVSSGRPVAIGWRRRCSPSAPPLRSSPSPGSPSGSNAARAIRQPSPEPPPRSAGSLCLALPVEGHDP